MLWSYFEASSPSIKYEYIIPKSNKLSRLQTLSSFSEKRVYFQYKKIILYTQCIEEMFKEDKFSSLYEKL